MTQGFALHRRARAGLFAAALAACLAIGAGPAPAQPPVPLAANDVSILFPVPKTPADLAGLIALKDLVHEGPPVPGRLWTDADFSSFVTIAKSKAGSVTNDGQTSQISFPAGTETIDAWFIAGIRVDVGAPGLSPDVMNAFGQIPQIRFIAQPVTIEGGNVVVHDMAAHLIFSFAQAGPPQEAGCLPKFTPDLTAFRPVLADFVTLRDDLAAGKFGPPQTTAGPLGVHPGLSGPTQKAFRDALKATLEKDLISLRLGSMAVMGVPAPNPEPWIFLSMSKFNGTFSPVPGPALNGPQFAQMLRAGSKFVVFPPPVTNNQNPITCRNNIMFPPTSPQPVAERKGVATAELFSTTPTVDRVREVTGIVADPDRSHFFNTDCVSCHTETRRALSLNAGPITGIAVAAMPAHDWNVRNFGWFPNFFDDTVKPSVTRRTAAETEAVVKAANALLATQ